MRKSLAALGRRARGWALAPIADALSRTPAPAQQLLTLGYQQRYADNLPAPTFSEVGFGLHSQFDEDGILLYLFALLGAKNRLAVEICAGDGRECNAANLIIHHGWHGLLFDGAEANVRVALDFFRAHPSTRGWPPVFVKAWITAENVNQLITSNGFSGEIDLLSIDIDGNDYWLWQALTAVLPRVVVVEVNHLCGPDLAVTVPYNPKFQAVYTEYGTEYAGASLAAFTKLARKKGYRLVGVNRVTTNAFFVRADLPHPWLPEVDPKDCFQNIRAQYGMNTMWPRVKDMPWEQV